MSPPKQALVGRSHIGKRRSSSEHVLEVSLPWAPHLLFLEPPSFEAEIISFLIINMSGRVSSWQRGVQQESIATESLSLVDSVTEASGITVVPQ